MLASDSVGGQGRAARCRGRLARAARPDDGVPPNERTRGRVPRVTRLMALAIRFNQLVREGRVESYAELARLGHVTRARVTQIMNMLNLAPDIQEAILDLSHSEMGGNSMTERSLRTLDHPDWQVQRTRWAHGRPALL